MKKIALLIALVMVFAGSPAFAKTSKSKSNAKTQAQIESINSVKEEIKALKAERKAKMAEILSQARQGSKGDFVKNLQMLLALDPSIYPEGVVSGYYGKLTSEAVKKFQKKYGLPQVGMVGPQTLEKLKKFAEDNDLTVEEETDSNGKAKGLARKLCAIIPPGHFIAPGLLKKTGGVAPSVPTCQVLPKGIKDKIDGIKPLPDSSDKTAPVITEVKVNDITTTSAKFTWTTNENSKTTVWYMTTSPVVTASATKVEDNSYVKSHSIVANSLTANTVYYFVVGSEDLAGNDNVSAQGTFTTLQVADTTDPVISNLVSSEITSTGAKITWTTDEGTKDKIWYSTSAGVDTSGSANMEDNTLDTAHTFNLTGLTASTTYYFRVSSTDASGNDVMSGEMSFTTPAS